MRMLVTGGAGYLGRVVCPFLLHAGHDVRILDAFLYEDVDAPLIRSTIAPAIRKDIRAISAADFENIDALVHLAAISNDPTADFLPAETRSVNIDGTRAVLESARAAGVSRVIFASTASVYDGQELHANMPMPESARLQPRGLYAETKYAGEMLIHEYARECGAVILRFGTLFGYSSRMRFDLVVNAFVRAALEYSALTIFGDGLNRRPIVDVRDAAAAIAHAVHLNRPGVVQTYNIVTANARICDIAETVRRLCGPPDFPDIAIQYKPAPERSRDYCAADAAWKLAGGCAFAYLPEQSIAGMHERLTAWSHERRMNPLHENIAWLRARYEDGQNAEN